MAVVAPVFLLIVWGIIEFGRAMMAAQLVTVVSREGARLGSLDGTTNSDIELLVDDMLVNTLRVSAADITTTITVTPAPGNDDPANVVFNAQSGDRVKVKVQIPYQKVNVFPTLWLTGTNLSAEMSMRHY